MYKAILLLLSVICLVACKKKDAEPTTFLLSKVIVNGQTEEEYMYNSAAQLVEANSYSLQNGVVYKYRYSYNYDATGRLKDMLATKLPETKPYSKWIYATDETGRIKRMSVYSLTGADSGKLSTHIDVEYNANSHVSKQVWKDDNEEVKYGRCNTSINLSNGVYFF